jgi:general secretion pathway protein J
VRAAGGMAPALSGGSGLSGARRLEFSRFASVDGVDAARRIAYRLNEQQQLELWLWPGLDVAPNARPERYPLLDGVTGVELRYLNAGLTWVDAWPATPGGVELPRALQLRIVLASGEQIVRIFEIKSS